MHLTTLRRRVGAGFVAAVAAASLVACGGDDPGTDSSTAATTPADGITAPGETSGGTDAATAAPATQPPLPADPAAYTPEYVEATLVALFGRYRDALVQLKTAGSVDESVRATMTEVYHPDVYDIQVRNLEDYYGDGADVADEPGSVVVTVDRIHSATAECILAVTTFDIQALTKLDAPAQENFFVGLARNPDAAATDWPWLITVEYSTSSGEPLAEDVCS